MSHDLCELSTSFQERLLQSGGNNDTTVAYERGNIKDNLNISLHLEKGGGNMRSVSLSLLLF